MGMSHFSDIGLPQMEPTFISRVGRLCISKDWGWPWSLEILN